jgi:phospholipase/lecithinase/hemolysin
MRMSLSWRVGGLAAFALSTLAVSCAAVAAAPSKIVAFGDSLSDTGNLAARLATVGVISPADPYDQGRFSNGAIAVEVMADRLGVSLESYGYGGAKTGLDNRTTTTGTLLNGTGVEGQINSYVTQQSGALDPTALYVVWAAGNDFFDAPVGATVLSASQNLAKDVSLLYAAGARQFFVPTLPDLGQTADSIAKGEAVVAGAHAMTVAFNGALAAAMQQVAASSPGANIQVYDVNPVLTAVRNGYISAGGNVTTGCWSGNYKGYADPAGTLCANPAAYYLWDQVHPTANVHRYMGEAFAAAVPEPATYAQLMLGLVAVAGVAVRRRATA